MRRVDVYSKIILSRTTPRKLVLLLHPLELLAPMLRRRSEKGFAEASIPRTGSSDPDSDDLLCPRLLLRLSISCAVSPPLRPTPDLSPTSRSSSSLPMNNDLFQRTEVLGNGNGAHAAHARERHAYHPRRDAPCVCGADDGHGDDCGQDG
ncbi:hypothetical protein CVT26_004660 [Gymnopilus dilepis]|uniref:Uncharacterized protein n=1 Tax=Gymnopilus dilepis TaxID=231916 RepID=A0A409YTN6_9AGAR|nr:hypothetical protein CVT26_004660 [Gymnopilus dilepis]